MEEATLTSANTSSQEKTAFSNPTPSFTTIVHDRHDSPTLPRRKSIKPLVFLAVAGEIRNRIYEHALVHDRNKGFFAAPNLLRTCKQVYREARKYLYDFSTLSIAAHILFPASLLSSQTSFRGDLVKDVWDRPSSLSVFDFAWPRHWHLVKSFCLSVKFCAHGQMLGSHDFSIVNHLLYSLVAAFNMDPTARRCLTIEFPAGNPLSKRSVTTILYPALKLPPTVQLLVRGVTPDIEAHIQKMQERVSSWPTAKFSPYEVWKWVAARRNCQHPEAHDALETARQEMSLFMKRRDPIQYRLEREVAETTVTLAEMLREMDMA